MTSPTSGKPAVTFGGQHPQGKVHSRKKSGSVGSVPQQRSKIYDLSSSSNPSLGRQILKKEKESEAQKVGEEILRTAKEEVKSPRSPRPPLKKRKGREQLRLSPEQLERMSRQEKLTRLKQLNSWKSEGNVRETMNAEEALDVPNLIEALTRQGEEQLVALLLVKNDIFQLHSSLRLSMQSVINPKQFFNRVLELMKSGTLTEQEIIDLLMFSRQWVIENRKTKKFPKEELEQIAKVSTKVKSDDVAIAGSFLIATLDDDEVSSEESRSPSPGPLQDFVKDYLENVKNGEEASEAVETMADDLFLAQIHLYCSTNPDDLIKKWETKSGYGGEVEHFIQLNNGISDFVITTVLREGDFDKRVHLTHFFLSVAEACLVHKGDYCSASAIYTALMQRVFDLKLKKTMTFADRNGVLEKLGNLLSMGQLAKEALREDMKEREVFIPLQSLYTNDIQKIEEAVDKVKDYDFNIDKLSAIQGKVMEFYKQRAVWDRSPLRYESPRTNLVSQHLAACFGLDDDEQERLASKYKDKEAFTLPELAKLYEDLVKEKKYRPDEILSMKVKLQKMGIFTDAEIQKKLNAIENERKYLDSQVDEIMSKLAPKDVLSTIN